MLFDKRKRTPIPGEAPTTDETDSSEELPLSNDPNPLVAIEMVSEFELVLDGGKLILPEIYYSPVDLQRRPDDFKPVVEVEGTASALARSIREAYERAVAHQPPPKRLKSEYSLSPEPIPYPSRAPLGKDAMLTLRAGCTYRVPDVNGNPVAAGRCAGVTCNLVPARDVWPRRRLIVRPNPLTIIDGDKAATLEMVVQVDPLFAQDGRAGQRPSLSMELIESDSWLDEWRLVGIRQTIERALATRQQPIASNDCSEWRYELKLGLDLRGAEREQFRKAVAAREVEAVEIPVRVSTEWAEACELKLRLEPKQEPYPGQVAIDLGTSACSVTVCEPAEILPRPLPADQERVLRAEFERWLGTNPAKALPGVAEVQWVAALRMVAEALGLDTQDPIAAVKDCFVPSPGDDDAAKVRMHEAIRRIELVLRKQPETLRRAASTRLHRIYRKVFGTFPFQGLNLITLPLEPQAQDYEQLQLESEMELLDLDPLRANMGRKAAENRRQALIAPEGEDKQADDRKIVGTNRFIPSPKQYLEFVGRDEPELPLRFEAGAVRRLAPRDVMKLAWEKLLTLFDEYRRRHQHNFSRGPVREAVVTFPTTLLPEPRKEIPRILSELGVLDVKMKYDEAVSAAIFYLQLTFGNTDIGPEAFKTRCHREGSIWVHHLLILDIGGGTTDTALIRIELRDSGARGEQGAGGRVYTIVPTLLGSSGNAHLGGDQITLRTFRLLKLALADYLLQHAPLRDGTEGDSSYHAGRLLQILDADLREPEFRTALDDAEAVLPTRFSRLPAEAGQANEERARRVRLFNKLWDLAEDIKRQLGGHRADEPEIEYTITPQQIVEICRHTGRPLSLTDDLPDLAITSSQLTKVGEPVIGRALRIARGVTETGFETLDKARLAEPDRSSAKKPAEAPVQMLDRLVLSGRSCHLGMVRDLLEQEMLLCRHYASGGTDVVFEPEYAKQATSVGACRAENLWGASISGEGWDEHLRAGINDIHIEIRNLFYFLPCSFHLRDVDMRLVDEVFRAHERLRQLDDTPFGKIRSPDWRPPQPRGDLYRIDYIGDTGRHWGTLNLGSLARRLDTDVDDLANRLRARYEITHNLQVQVLLCSGERPLYAMPQNVDRINILERLKERTNGITAFEQTLGFDLLLKTARGEHLVFAGDRSFDLSAVRNTEGPREDPEVEGDEYLRFVCNQDAPLPEAQQNGKYSFYARLPGHTNLYHCGDIVQPELTGYDFECSVHALLDQEGWLRLIIGEPPYWMTDNQRDLIDRPGCVLPYSLELSHRDRDPYSDPFSGVH